MGKRKNQALVLMAGAAVAETASVDPMDSLIAELGMGSETVETVEGSSATDTDLEAAVAGAETIEHYEAQPGDPTPEQVAADAKAAAEAEKAAAKAEKQRIAAEKKAERERIAAEKKVAKEAEKQRKAEERAAKKAAREAEKAAKPKRVFWGSDKIGRLKATLGDQLSDYMVLTTADASLSADELAANQTATMEAIEKIGVKVKNRACFLFDYLSGKVEKMNGVMETTLRVLAKDGKIVTGDKGNLHTTLLAKPYSAGTARATGNNTVALFKILKMIVPSADKQTFVANPDSLLLAKANTMLGIS